MRESSVLACASSRLDPAVLGALTTSGGSHSEGRPPHCRRAAGRPGRKFVPAAGRSCGGLAARLPQKSAIAQLLLPGADATATLRGLACTALYI